ncbi:MAG: FHA domain-containing protein [Isosphaeraceae bacterium]
MSGGPFTMLTLGGKSTMLGHWRIALRQAEESARAGRFDEALAMVNRQGVADHRLAVKLRNRLVLDLVARASRRADADDVPGAIADLNLAGQHGVAPDVLAAARLRLAEQVADEVRLHLDTGEPGRVVEMVEALAKDHVGGPTLRRMREAAEAWQLGLDEQRRGEFGLARDSFDRAERLAGDSAAAPLSDARRDLAARQEASKPLIERLYAALSATNWGDTLAAAEAVLDALPDHPAARQARSRAWQQIGGLSPNAALPARADRVANGPVCEPRAAADQDDGIMILDIQDRSPRWPDAALRPVPKSGNARLFRANAPVRQVDPQGPGGRFLLWADAIGGYLVCQGDRVVLGRAGPEGLADVPLLGDLSRQHATIIRDGDGYVLKAHHPCFVNGRRIDTTSLRQGDVIRLGASVELEFHQPSPVSASARLSFVSRHRLPVAVDGILLMAETCIIGPSAQAHIRATDLKTPVVLYHQDSALWCRAAGTFEVDGHPQVARAPLGPTSKVQGDRFSFSLEPLATRSDLT